MTGSALLSALFVALTLTVGYSVGVLPARLVSLGAAPIMITLATWLWWRGHIQRDASLIALAALLFVWDAVWLLCAALVAAAQGAPGPTNRTSATSVSGQFFARSDGAVAPAARGRCRSRDQRHVASVGHVTSGTWPASVT